MQLKSETGVTIETKVIWTVVEGWRGRRPSRGVIGSHRLQGFSLVIISKTDVGI